MANKKLLFVTSNPSQFKGFFRNKLNALSKESDIYLLIYTYGFKNRKLKNHIYEWTKDLKKKLIIKRVWYLSEYSYTNTKQNINFNVEFLKIIKKIDLINFDILLISNIGNYWEKILVEYYNKKKKIAFLLSPPSGMDLFNSFSDFMKSLKLQSFFLKKGKFIIRSDNNYLHQKNTNSSHLNKKSPILSFVIEKIKVRINLFINFFIIPTYLNIFKLKKNSFVDQINFNFLNVDGIICFHKSLVQVLKTMYPNTKIKHLNLNNNKIKNSKQKKWIFLCDNNNKATFEKLYKIIINLKKINRINLLYIKQHPTWLSSELDVDFKKKLKEIKIPYMILEKTKNVIYENIEGIILEPGSSIIEGLTHKENLKILAIKSNYNLTSGAIFQFYKKFDEICWNHDVRSLKKYFKYNTLNDKKIKKFEIKNLNF